MRQSLPLMHFYSGKLLQFYSGVDSPGARSDLRGLAVGPAYAASIACTALATYGLPPAVRWPRAASAIPIDLGIGVSHLAHISSECLVELEEFRISH